LPVTAPPLESTKVMPLLPLACGAAQPVRVLLVMDTVLASPAKTMMPLALPAGPLLPMSVIVLWSMVACVPLKSPSPTTPNSDPTWMPFWAVFAVWAPTMVLSWTLAVSVEPLTKMPVFWKPLTVEFSISTVWAPVPPWATS